MGFPIRKSLGQRVFATSPELIAGYHVLHRLLLPRHPPCTLSHLTIQLKNNLLILDLFPELYVELVIRSVMYFCTLLHSFWRSP